MALSNTTGIPSAVTYEQIEAWRKLADDVTAALTMGGQQGMDLLVGIITEWCEAVDDVNAARQICVELAGRGLRHEAIHWHADGFFEVADRLDPNRPGWDAWEAALRDLDIITPRIDSELRDMANRIHDDLETVNLSGESLQDCLASLRRNVLLRGNLGERLVILESIRGLDPSGEAWHEMLGPIRRRRVDAIADEVRAAIDRKDFEALSVLQAEVASQDWRGELPPEVYTKLNAMLRCQTIGELRSQLSQCAATIVGRVEEARRLPGGSANLGSLAEAANVARKRYAEIHSNLLEHLKVGAAAPEGAAFIAQTGVRDAIRKLGAALQEPCMWLNEQAAASRARALAGDIEAVLLRHVEAAPPLGVNKEAFAAALATWTAKSQDLLEQARRETARMSHGVPSTTEAVIQGLKEKRQELESHLDELKRRERNTVIYVLCGVGAFLLFIVVVIVVAVNSR